MEKVIKIYTVFPDLVSSLLLDECNLNSSAISQFVIMSLSDFADVNSDTLYVNLDFCEFNSFLYTLYYSLSNLLSISFGVFYQMVLDVVDCSEM